MKEHDRGRLEEQISMIVETARDLGAPDAEISRLIIHALPELVDRRAAHAAVEAVFDRARLLELDRAVERAGDLRS